MSSKNKHQESHEWHHPNLWQSLINGEDSHCSKILPVGYLCLEIQSGFLGFGNFNLVERLSTEKSLPTKSKIWRWTFHGTNKQLRNLIIRKDTTIKNRPDIRKKKQKNNPISWSERTTNIKIKLILMIWYPTKKSSIKLPWQFHPLHPIPLLGSPHHDQPTHWLTRHVFLLLLNFLHDLSIDLEAWLKVVWKTHSTWQSAWATIGKDQTFRESSKSFS